MKKVIVVTGTRTDNRKGDCARALDELHPDLVLVGDMTGIDAEARDWCIRRKVPRIDFAATTGWPAAGPRRNNLMAYIAWLIKLEGGAKVSFIAFPWGEARGTTQCSDALKARGIPGPLNA